MELVSFISHIFSDTILEHYNTIKNSLRDDQELIFVSTNEDIIDILNDNKIKHIFVSISKDKLYSDCIQIDNPARNPHLITIYLDVFNTYSQYSNYWFIENDVTVYNPSENNSFRNIFDYFANNNYDLVCDHLMNIMSNFECKLRYSYFLQVAILDKNINKYDLWKGFFTICRFSNNFLSTFNKALNDNDIITKLFFEIGVPTFAKLNEFSCFSLDENNLFSIRNIEHPFTEPDFRKLHSSVNTGSNSWAKKPYHKTNNYLMYHDNTIVHSIKSKDVKLHSHEHYNENLSDIKIWACGNKFEIPSVLDKLIYNKFDLSLKYSRYNINEFNRIFSEFVMMHYIYANNIYSKYIGTAHYHRYPVKNLIDFKRIENNEIQFFCWFNNRRYLDISTYNNPNFALVEHQVNEFDGPDMLKTDMIEYLQSNKVIDVDRIIEYTKHREFITYYMREIFVMKWEMFCEMMQFVEGYIKFISHKYNIYSLFDWIEHVRTKVIEEYRKPKRRTFMQQCYQLSHKFETINNATNGYQTSNCWRVYSYMIEMLISIYIGTHKNFSVFGSFYEL